MRSSPFCRRLLFAQALFLASAWACTSPPDTPNRNQVTDSAGIRVVRSVDPLWEEEEAWWVPQEPSISIGTFSGRDEYQLVEVSSGALTDSGEIVVADRGARTVSVYDRSGVFLRTLGGPGSGPGEFQDPVQVVISPGDSVLIWDEQAFRVTRFGPSGQLAGVETLDLAELSKVVAPPLYPGTVRLMENGDYLIRLVEKAEWKGPAALAESYRNRSGALWVSRDLSSIDTLAFFRGVEQVTVEAPFGRYPIPVPLGRDTWWTHGSTPPRVCIGDQEDGEIACFSRRGTSMKIRWASEPLPITQVEMEEWREENLRLFGPKLTEDEVLAMLEQVTPPPSRPPHSRLLLDKGGNLWAKLGPREGRKGVSFEYLVFEPSGQLLGTVSLPAMEVLEIGQDYVLGVHRGDLDVEYVRLHELNKLQVVETGIPSEER